MLHARAADVPDAEVEMRSVGGGGGLSTKQVFGSECSLMVATRGAGYHSRPHVHDCEQLNYVAAGEIWIFVGDRGVLLHEGDFLRVPRMQVHWAWNRSDRDCRLIEAHSPGLDILAREQTVDLLDEGEPVDAIERVPMVWASDDYLSVEQGIVNG